MAKQLSIHDADGCAVALIPVDRQAFLNWRKKWAKTVNTSPRDVAIVIILEQEPQPTMLVDSGAALVRLARWLAEGWATTCEIVIKTPDMEEFAGHDVWRTWRPPRSEKTTLGIPS